MPNQGDLPSIIVTLVVIGVILFTGTYIANGVVETDPGGGEVTEPAVLDGTNWVTLGDKIGTNEQVYNSLGYAVNLSGSSDSYFRTTEDVQFTNDDSWTVSVWAAADQSATSERTVVSLDGEVVITYKPAEGNWSGWYYDEGERDSYEVNVTATDQPGNLTNVILERDGNSLTIYQNNTAGETETLSNDSIVDAPVTSNNWDGRIDEVRTFDDALSSSQRSSLQTDPAAPLVGTNRTARIMFDEPGEKKQLLFFAPGSVTTSSVTYGDGVPGKKMQGKTVWNDITSETDYRWKKTGPQIKAVDGGELDGAPAAYVTYTTKSNLDTFADDWTQTIQMAAILFILLPLGTIIMYLKTARNGR